MCEEFDNYDSYSELYADLVEHYYGDYEFVLDKSNLENLLYEGHYLGRVMDSDYTASIEITDEARDWLNGVVKQTKVVVPMIFDDWFKRQKISKYSLVSYVSGIANAPKSNPLETWIADNWETAVKAIIEGYQVEKTKRYYVSMKSLVHIDSFLNYYVTNKNFVFGSKPDSDTIQTRFEKAWLRENFEPFETLLDNGLIELIEVDD